MVRGKRYWFFFPLLIILSGCSKEDGGLKGLNEFIAQIKSLQSKTIDPLPTVKVYEPFSYGASGLRSPFSSPDSVSRHSQLSSNVKPDLERIRHFLEEFSFDDFSLVGTLEKENETKGLVKVGNNIYLVSKGDYLGRNHGRVVNISEKEIDVVELIPTGVNAWIERPRRLSLK